jgi:hypothetical protein
VMLGASSVDAVGGLLDEVLEAGGTAVEGVSALSPPDGETAKDVCNVVGSWAVDEVDSVPEGLAHTPFWRLITSTYSCHSSPSASVICRPLIKSLEEPKGAFTT